MTPNRFESLYEEVGYALDEMRIEVNHAKYFADKNATEGNMSYLKKAQHNVQILESIQIDLESLEKL